MDDASARGGGAPRPLTQRSLTRRSVLDTLSHMNTAEKPVRFNRDRPTTPRLLRELETIEAMTRIYCADHHDAPHPCADCQALTTYASKRLAVCTYGEDKPVCAKCQIHCYGKAMREKVRDVMRYSGPRMVFRHPWLALMHVVDKRHVAPPKPNAAAQPVGPTSPPAAAAPEAPGNHPSGDPSRPEAATSPPG
jgi:Nitrous oxide-stimulated promoter